MSFDRDHVVRVVDGGRTTHYIVPAAEYERLVGRERPIEPSEDVIAEAERMIADPGVRWKRTGELAGGLAWRRLDLARRARNLTQRELAERAGLSQSMVSRIERDPSHASVDALRRIAEVLEVDVAALIEAIGEGESRAAG